MVSFHSYVSLLEGIKSKHYWFFCWPLPSPAPWSNSSQLQDDEKRTPTHWISQMSPRITGHDHYQTMKCHYHFLNNYEKWLINMVFINMFECYCIIWIVVNHLVFSHVKTFRGLSPELHRDGLASTGPCGSRTLPTLPECVSAPLRGQWGWLMLVVGV